MATNTVSKSALAFTAGGRTFGGRFAAVLALPAAAVTAALVVVLN